VSDPKPTSRTWFALGVGAALVLAYVLRGVLVPLLFAFLLAYLLDPIVTRLHRWGVPRAAGAAVVMAALFALFVLFVLFGVPLLIDEVTDAASKVPTELRVLYTRTDVWLADRFHVHLPATWAEVTSRYGDVLSDSVPSASALADALFGTLSALLVALGTLIVPVFALYLLADLDRIVERAGALVPRRWAGDAHRLAAEIHNTLGRYVRGQVIACLVLGLVYATALEIVGVRLAVVIGVLTGLLAFVPYVGLATGMGLAVVMALLDWQSAGHVALVVVVMGSIGVLDAMVITPRIVGGSVGLKPIEVLLTMMAAASLFGFLGVVLAVPLGAVVKILVGHAVDAYLRSPFYADSAPAPSDATEPASQGGGMAA
jgi:predicted PurR-regulated permease PerM